MKPIEILSAAVERDGTTGVAKTLGVPKSAVSEWANGKREIPAAVVLYLAEYLGLPEPDHYEVIAAATKQPKLREWAEGKARAGSSAVLLFVAIVVGSLVSPTVEAHGIKMGDISSQLYIMRNLR